MYNEENNCFSVNSEGRRKGCLKVLKLNINVYQNYYRYKAISVFNELNIEIRLIHNKGLFEIKTKKYLMSTKH